MPPANIIRPESCPPPALAGKIPLPWPPNTIFELKIILYFGLNIFQSSPELAYITLILLIRCLLQTYWYSAFIGQSDPIGPNKQPGPQKIPPFLHQINCFPLLRC